MSEKPGPAGEDERLTPWELVFGAPGFDAARFERVREQAERADASAAATLLMLPAAGEILRELLPDDAGNADDATRRELIEQAGALLFHAYRFWLHERRVYLLGRELIEQAVPAAAAEWRFAAPVPAGYVQLPHQLFWARVADDAAPEPVDGFFWSAPFLDAAAGGPVADRLDVLMVLGLRRGRPGVSLVDIAVEPARELERWGALQVRPDGEDFANILPGGELQGYRALTTRAEALKLAMICFRLVDEHAGAASGDAEDGAVRRVRVDG
jgi:hypothetical protein